MNEPLRVKASERFVCSDASEARGEPVTHTASQVGAWLLIEVHGAWGSDAITESELGPHVPDGWKADLQSRGIRPICIRPIQRSREQASVRLFFVTVTRPGVIEGVVWTRSIPKLKAVQYLTDDLRVGEQPDGWQTHDERLVLVCTNGKHDQCCANRGRPVVRHLRGSRWADQVWECSHIGGDRFAANLVVLPDGLYFGRMEPAEAEAILDSHASGRVELEWFRGRSSLRYAEQAVEQDLRRRFDASGTDDIVFVGSPGGAGGRFRVEVRDVGSFDVAVQRTVDLTDEPLTCRGTPNQRIPRFTVDTVTPV